MGFRVVLVKNRAKLDLRMNYMICRSEIETKIYVPEISVLILESTAISLTCALLSELVKHNVKIIFCDEKHNPESELVSYYGTYNSAKKIKSQMQWTRYNKERVWTEIVKQKIIKQKDFLQDLKLNDEAQMLKDYMQEIEHNDETNREGHSAKVYFNAVFGTDFSRRSISFTNKALNYGYSVLLSCFNREIVQNGYLTQLGIWHKNEFNHFNLASDLMEPFRILIDRIVYDLDEKEGNFKVEILRFLETKVTIDGKKQTVDNAISIYCKSVFDALETGDMEQIKFYEM